MSEAPATVEDQTYTKTILVPDIDWVTIPAGEFIYGEGETQTTLYLDAFEIARYPVTNAQYQTFVDDKGYEDERWWQGLKKLQLEASKWPQGNRPKVNVSWFEATAFTRWLSARLDDNIRLPFEQEWEKAARGEKGLVYPWGSEYESGFANINESDRKGGAYLKQTTAVGLYPHDESSNQIRDMCGNVLEWCNEFGTESVESDDDESRMQVLRGGSWILGPEFARAAFRHGGSTYHHDINLGFRLLRSPVSPYIGQSWNSLGSWNSVAGRKN